MHTHTQFENESINEFDIQYVLSNDGVYQRKDDVSQRILIYKGAKFILNKNHSPNYLDESSVQYYNSTKTRFLKCPAGVVLTFRN